MKIVTSLENNMQLLKTEIKINENIISLLTNISTKMKKLLWISFRVSQNHPNKYCNKSQVGFTRETNKNKYSTIQMDFPVFPISLKCFFGWGNEIDIISYNIINYTVSNKQTTNGTINVGKTN